MPNKANYDRITERAFTEQVIALAQWYKWKIAHFRPAQDRHGRWKTPVQGDGVGFPDLVIMRRNRAIIAELKSSKGSRMTPEQQEWLETAKAAGFEAFLWRPSMIDEIEEILK